MRVLQFNSFSGNYAVRMKAPYAYEKYLTTKNVGPQNIIDPKRIGYLEICTPEKCDPPKI